MDAESLSDKTEGFIARHSGSRNFPAIATNHADAILQVITEIGDLDGVSGILDFK